MADTKEVTLEVPEGITEEQLRRAVEVVAAQEDSTAGGTDLRERHDRGHRA